MLPVLPITWPFTTLVPAGASLLLGQNFAFLETTLIHDYQGFLLMLLPPGGFLVLGFLLAGRRVLEQRRRRVERTASAPGPMSSPAN